MMIPETILATAVERAILSPEQAVHLRELARELAPKTAEPADEEKLRFISGFGDIFVALGLGLFLYPLSYFGGQIFTPAGSWVLIAATCWALAEFFTRRRRMALPSIVLLITFAAALFLAVWSFQLGDSSVLRPALRMTADQGRIGMAFTLAGLAAALGTALHYYRFRVPITPAAGGAALVVAVVGVLTATLGPDLAGVVIRPVLFVCGITIFAVAMRFDASDPLRLTRRTDIAFWLHLLAAPLIVHSLVAGMLQGGTPSTGVAWAVLAVFLVLAAVAIHDQPSRNPRLGSRLCRLRLRHAHSGDRFRGHGGALHHSGAGCVRTYIERRLAEPSRRLVACPACRHSPVISLRVLRRPHE